MYVEAPYARLYEVVQRTRTLIMRFNQWQWQRERKWRPDLMQIHFTRVLILYDLLHLQRLDPASTGLQMTYDLCRHGCLAFMQLVLFPIATNNDRPNKLLSATLPVLRSAQIRLSEGTSLGRQEKQAEN